MCYVGIALQRKDCTMYISASLDGRNSYGQPSGLSDRLRTERYFV